MSQAWEAEENRLHPDKKTILSSRNNQHVQPLSIQEVPTVTIKQALLEIGRYCKCGCGHKIPEFARKDRVFFSAMCRRVYANKNKGYSESKNVVRARLRIKQPITLTLYPGNGDVIKIKIPKECKELYQYCHKIEKERQE